MNKLVWPIVGVIIIGALFVISRGNDNKYPDLNNNTATTTQATSTISVATSTKFTLVEVSKHNNASDCYSTINSKVYNLTSWISKHPGGEGAILSICGKDGTAAFEGQHGDSGKPNQILSTFYIGDLIQ